MLKYKIIGQRNPVFEFFNEQNPSLILYRIQVIGDCHLGRKFLNGVPKNRLNQREQIVFSKFENILNQKDYIENLVLQKNVDDTEFKSFLYKYKRKGLIGYVANNIEVYKIETNTSSKNLRASNKT